MTNRIRCAALLFVVAAASPASSESISPPPREIAVSAFGCERETAVTDLRVDLVIDDSRSMAGFLRVADGAYRELLRRLTDRRAAGRLTIRSLNRPRQTVDFSEELSREGFYRFDTTPLQNAFKRVESDASNVVTVLVSDLVQSGSGDIQTATDALTAALDCAPNALVVGISSPYYEDSRRCAPHCRSDTTSHFYVIALAHDKRHLRAFITATGIEGLADNRTADDIREGKGEGPTLFHSNAGLLRPFNIEINAPWHSEWTPVPRETTTITCDGGLTFAPFVAFTSAAKRDRQLTRLFLRAEVRADASIADTAAIHTDIDQTNAPGRARAERTTKSWLTPIRWTPLQADGELNAVEFGLDVELPPTNQWRIFRIRSSIESGPLHLPWWVEKWSGEAQPTDGTLALESLVRTILNWSAGTTPLIEMWIGAKYQRPI